MTWQSRTTINGFSYHHDCEDKHRGPGGEVIGVIGLLMDMREVVEQPLGVGTSEKAASLARLGSARNSLVACAQRVPISLCSTARAGSEGEPPKTEGAGRWIVPAPG